MSIHKLNPERGAAEHGALAVGLNFHHEIHRFPETILKARAIRALENIAAKYPVYRHVRYASQRKLEELFDDLALHSGLSACRLGAGSLLLEGPGIFISAEGWRTGMFVSCGFNIWTDSMARIEETREKLLQYHRRGVRASADVHAGLELHGQPFRAELHDVRRTG